MSSTPNAQLSSIRRLKQDFYIDVPPSPLPLSRYSSLGGSTPLYTAGVASGRLKESTPLALTKRNMTYIADSPSHKRKLSEQIIFPSMVGPAKKPKLAKVTAKPPLSSKPIAETMTHAADNPTEFSNGHAYCHQCSKKRDISECLRCTAKEMVTSKGRSKERRCANKFCKTCLKNRYGEDIDEILKQRNDRKENGHTETASDIFKCPKCRGICNCWRCRKLKGLEPTGKLVHPACKAGAFAPYVLITSRKTAGTVPANGIQVKNVPKTKNDSAGTLKKTSNALKEQKPLPVLNWTRIATNLNLEQAEMRFQIREFMNRFVSIMEPSISKAHLAELEDISGARSRDGLIENVGWVSEGCLRSILLGVLSLLVDKDNGSINKPIRTMIKDIRSTGTNLNNILSILLRFRDSVNSIPSGSGPLLSFPDPLPPPASTVVYNTRNLRNAVNPTSVRITHSMQMVPIINALIEAAFDTNTVRAELDHGVTYGKEIAREARECIKKENDKWDIERARIESLENIAAKTLSHEMKTKRQAHQQHIQRLELALKLTLPGFAPRFTPLGRDHEGRVYYALSPGESERRAALDFISSGANENTHQINKGKAKDYTCGEKERNAMTQWSWFVAVWGKRPLVNPTASSKARTQSHNINGSEDDDEDTEKWWGFCEPQAIRDVAVWLAASFDSSETLPGTSSHLTKGLNEYATLLEWRLQGDKYMLLG